MVVTSPGSKRFPEVNPKPQTQLWVARVARLFFIFTFIFIISLQYLINQTLSDSDFFSFPVTVVNTEPETQQERVFFPRLGEA
jgi:cytochrome b561